MSQQINLLAPILLAPRRYLSATTLLQAAALLLVVGGAMALWLHQRDRSAHQRHQALLGQYEAERQQLLVARVNLPAPQDAAALQQQVQALQDGNAARAALLRMLGSASDDQAGQRHSDVLALVARTLPDTAWISELRYAPNRLELAGGTLDTAQLRPWLSRLAAHPLLAGQQLSALRVERLGAPGTDDGNGNASLLQGAGLTARPPLPVWAFHVVSAPAASASGATR
ncbi:PilN domain-containing protein [Roseateles sp. DC23W]|uniref:PilN domain-containing protein n=1 Tax=Pelomonas dachongensis TaxID=3299029 RepID=A0ABW7EIL1_9BURK